MEARALPLISYISFGGLDRDDDGVHRRRVVPRALVRIDAFDASRMGNRPSGTMGLGLDSWRC
jgi:hypothetical protein